MQCAPIADFDGFVEVDGARVRYLRAGSGPPLILIHGLIGSASNWRKNIPSFARHATVYALDLVNMGQSDRVAGLDAGLEATADRIAAWMQALGIASADVAGHSHGGAVALMFAARHPNRVRSLILFAPANPFCTRSHSLIWFYGTRAGSLAAKLVPRLPRRLHLYCLGRMYGDPARVTDGTLEGYTAGLAVPGTIPYILGILDRWHSDMATLRNLLRPKVQAPTLLLWGERDQAVGLESGRQLAHYLSAQLEVVPDAGHVVFEEMPEECNLAVQNWLTQRNPNPPNPTVRTPHRSATPAETRLPSSGPLRPGRREATA